MIGGKLMTKADVIALAAKLGVSEDKLVFEDGMRADDGSTAYADASTGKIHFYLENPHTGVHVVAHEIFHLRQFELYDKMGGKGYAWGKDSEKIYLKMADKGEMRSIMGEGYQVSNYAGDLGMLAVMGHTHPLQAFWETMAEAAGFEEEGCLKCSRYPNTCRAYKRVKGLMVEKGVIGAKAE